MRTVNMGFVGCGFMGQLAHIANYDKLPGCRMVAVADPRRELASKVAAKYGIERVYRNHRELAADDDVEAVAAILPHMANGPVTMDLLSAGKHVIVEKPLASSASEGRAMAEAASKAGKHLLVGYMKRFDAGVQWARDAVAEWSAEGQGPSFVRAHCFGGDWLCGIEAPLASEDPYPQVAIATDGPEFLSPEGRQAFQQFTNIYIHNLNLVRYVVASDMRVLSATRHGPRMLVALAAGDALVSLECGGMRCQWWDEVTTVYFEDGYVDLRTPSPMLRNVPAQVERYRGGLGMRETPVPAWTWSFANQAAAFVAAVRGEIEPVNSAADAVRDLELAEDIFRAGAA